ncbi:MAG: hypothetical protein JNK92_08950 [Dechloromonas sp.]|nr:hypothetical protein [Dechloromonas sp.]
MVTLIVQIIVMITNHRINKLLLTAESSLPPHQFRSFRKLFMNEFGSKYRKDLEVELRKRLRTGKADGTERAGSYSQERGCSDE